MQWRCCLAVLALCWGMASASWSSVLEKAKAQESRLTEQIRAQCDVGNGQKTTSCGADCEELRLALAAAQQVTRAESVPIEGTAKWQEFMEAVEYNPAPGCYDVSAWIHEEPSAGMEHEERRTLVSMVLGRNVPDSYFLSDEREARRLQEWVGPRIAAGHPWPDKVLKYAMDPGIGRNSRRALQSAMEEIVEKSCVTFQEVPFDYTGGPYVQMISSEEGCWSGVGSGRNIRLNMGTGCNTHLTAVHELHALGQKHEQSRPDRDHFLDIRWNNIIDENLHNFEISANGYTGRPYDYMSIMHYSRFAFTKNSIAADMLVSWTLNQLGKLGIDTQDSTLQPRNSMYNGKLGSSQIMSDGDAEQLQDMYQCNKVAVSSEGSPGMGLQWELDTFSPEAIISEDWFKVGTGVESMPVHCNAGYAVTSCTCFHKDGECRGALVTEVAGGGTCVATPSKDETRDAKAHALCVKLASPHYSVSLLSAERSGVAEQSCAANYVLAGCSCSARAGQHCLVAPSDDGTKCVAEGPDGIVQVQAHCIRSLAIRQVTVAQGTMWYQESIARCTNNYQLLGCHCRGRSCAGARAMGPAKNSCKAVATNSNDQVVAVAICADLATFGDSVLPTAEYLTGGQVLDADGAGIQPIQSLYCSSAGAWSGFVDGKGCGGLKVQTRTKMEFDCTQSGCQETVLSVDASQVRTLTVSKDGTARCPAGWIVTSVTCQESCKSFELTCAPPPSNSPWYLSGGRSYSPWFNGKTGSAMGSCGQSLAIGLECASGGWSLEKSCKLIRLHCRRPALYGDDSSMSFSAFDMSFAEPRSTDWISSSGTQEMIFQFQFREKHDDTFENAEHRPVQRLTCRGNACDDMKAALPTKLGSWGSYVDVRGTPTIWTTRFMEEVEMRCPPGHYVANIRCHESFCQKKELLCALPDYSAGNWFVSGGMYYSHCFTNKGQLPWSDWIRDKLAQSKGAERSCAGMQPSQMPDSQSCGEDGVMIGLRCYGADCDRMQLVCNSVDANVNQRDGSLQDIQERRQELTSLGLYDDMSTWPWHSCTEWIS
eukprot:s215_g7.t1